MTTQFVLVPGFWLGAWAWDEVAAILREKGFAVDALTLPGYEEGASSGAVTLSDHARAIRQALDGEAARRVVVAHSGAAFAAALTIDQHPELVDHLVLVDTALPGDGTAFNAGQECDFEIGEAWDSLAEEGSFRDLTDEQLSTLRERARPVPSGVVSTPVHLTNAARLAIPVTTICTAFSADEYRGAAEQGVPYFADMPNYADLTYVDFPTGHWPMWSKPEELAALILAAAGRSTDG